MHITEVSLSRVSFGAHKNKHQKGKKRVFSSPSVAVVGDIPSQRKNRKDSKYELQDVFFRDGKVFDKHGDKITGKIDDNLKSSKHLIMLVSNGNILKSVKEGEFTKLYYYDDDSRLKTMVSYTDDGFSKKLDVTDDGFESFYGNPEQVKTTLYARFLSKQRNGNIEIEKIYRGHPTKNLPSAIATRTTHESNGDTYKQIYRGYIDHSFPHDVNRFTSSEGQTFVNGKEVARRVVDVNNRGEKLVVVYYGDEYDDSSLSNQLKMVKLIKPDGTFEKSTVRRINEIDRKNPKTMIRLIHDFKRKD